MRNKCHYIQQYLQTHARARRLFIRANLIFKKEQDHNNGLDAFVSSRNRAIFATKNAPRFSKREDRVRVERTKTREDETQQWGPSMSVEGTNYRRSRGLASLETVPKGWQAARSILSREPMAPPLSNKQNPTNNNFTLLQIAN